tara:strand:- start:402 stop:824 length:423 start_codon:yes stop_codon:yes gene_type:complete
MTSQLNVDTIVDKAGSGGTNIKVGNDATYVAEGGSATPNLVQGLLKMWVMFNGSSAPTTADSLNVGSLTDNGSGDYTINRTNAMNNANYSTSSMCDENGVVFINTGTYSTTANEIHVKDSNSQSKNDYDRIGVHVAGDLA